MKIIKKISIVLCLCLTAALWCGCETSNDSENIGTSELTSFESTPTEETVQAAISTAVSTSVVSTSEPEESELISYNYIYEDSDDFKLKKFDIEETEETVLAMDFATELTKCWLYGDENLIDLDKYIDNIYLKDYIKESLNYRMEFLSSYKQRENFKKYNVFVHPIYVEEKNGITYVYIGSEMIPFKKSDDIYYDKAYGHTDIIGIRDGKIVNAFGNPAIERLHYCVYGKPLYKAGDSTSNPNLWDDEQLAQRAVKAYKKYVSGEFKLFKDAWDSLEE